MKTNNPILHKMRSRVALAGMMLAAAIGTSHAAQHIVNSFDSSGDIGGWSYQNWDNSQGSFSFSAANDANNNAGSGSLKMVTGFDPAHPNGWGGAYRFGVNDFNASAYTALEYDVKVDAASGADQYGIAADFKLGVFTTSAYNYHANDLNISTVATNNGWQHVVLTAAATGGTEWNDVKEVFIQYYDNNYLVTNRAIIYLDNIKFTGPDPTYSNYTAFTFPEPTTLTGVVTNWYGQPLAIEWATNDAAGDPNSGSLHLVGTYAPNDNCFVCAIPFDTNFDHSFGTADTNFINGRNYTNVEMDILWDTNLSTVDIGEFNQKGDVSGFPLGLLVNGTGGGGGGQVEAFGSATTALPAAASNGWVHVSFPLNRTAPGIDQTIGLWLKKYNWGAISGTVAFYIDNVVFDGAPLAVPLPTVTLSKPVPGLQTVSTGTGGNPPYDRESLVTFDSSFNYVDLPDPISYAINIASFPPASYAGYAARIYIVPNVSGTAPEPDWAYPTVLFIEIQRNGGGSSATLHAKTNSPNSNGQYYTQTNPQFTNTSKIEGNWVVTITQNTNILIKAPDGSSGSLAFPVGFSQSDVSSLFGGGAVVYFGSIPNGSGNEGQRVVIASVGITNGSSTLLYDNFLEDSVLDINIGGGGKWLNATDTTRTDGVYLLGTNTAWFLDWTVNGGTGFLVQTNGTLQAPAAWATNGAVTSALVADHFHSEIDVTNVPAGGNAFFRVIKP